MALNRRALWLLFWALVAAITLVSLLPFNFVWPSPHVGIEVRPIDPGPGDALRNIYSFLPLGLLAALIHPPQLRAGRLLLLSGLMVVFAVVLQIGQLYLPQRVPSVGDAANNVIGLGLGVLLASAGGNIGRSWLARALAPSARTPAAVLLLGGLWFLAPLAFAPLPSVLLENAQYLAESPAFERDLILRRAAVYFALLSLAVQSGLLSRRRLGWAMLWLFAIKLAIVGVDFSRADLLAAGLALAVLFGFGAHSRAIDIARALFLLALIVWDGWFPFQLRDWPAAFEWRPFVAMLEGRPLIASLWALCFKLAVIAALLLSLARLMQRWRPAVLAVLLLFAAQELAQRYIDVGTPDITNLLLVLLLGGVLAGLDRQTRTGWPEPVGTQHADPVQRF